MSFRAWLVFCLICSCMSVVVGWAARVVFEIHRDVQIQQNHGDIATSRGEK